MSIPSMESQGDFLILTRDQLLALSEGQCCCCKAEIVCGYSFKLWKEKQTVPEMWHNQSSYMSVTWFACCLALTGKGIFNELQCYPGFPTCWGSATP